MMYNMHELEGKSPLPPVLFLWSALSGEDTRVDYQKQAKIVLKYDKGRNRSAALRDKRLTPDETER